MTAFQDGLGDQLEILISILSSHDSLILLQFSTGVVDKSGANVVVQFPPRGFFRSLVEASAGDEDASIGGEENGS
jgi:hypothetical protein